jgi:hypothetical protein
MLTPDNKEARITLAGDQITMADEDVDIFSNIITVSATKKCSEGRTIRRCQELGAKATRAQTGIQKWFPRMFPKIFRWQKCITTQGNCFERNFV